MTELARIALAVGIALTAVAAVSGWTHRSSCRKFAARWERYYPKAADLRRRNGTNP
jgi:hypothetical protein